MPGRTRIIPPGILLHVIQRGNNRQVCFYADEDYPAYLEWLGEHVKRSACAVHACVPMTHRVHLLVTPQTAGDAGELVKMLGQRYVRPVNSTCRPSGALWFGRFRSGFALEKNYALSCYRCIEPNPVRADMESHPAEYR